LTILEEHVADLEQRVATLEHEMSALKERVGANEGDLASLPDLIKLEFRLGNSQVARLSRDFADMRRDLGDLRGKVDALPRVVAELVTEVLAVQSRTKS
jgi:outer membrane murein-binding lipoprotein Lpp